MRRNAMSRFDSITEYTISNSKSLPFSLMFLEQELIKILPGDGNAILRHKKCRVRTPPGI